jgi:CheY-like chemotaxis protein
MNNKLVLLVEDNPDDEALAMRALTSGKIAGQTMVVRDGQEALDYLFYQDAFKERPMGNPQVILLDLKLPKVDGLEVLRQIRLHDSTKLIPVVILTSSNAERDIAASYTNGANSYIVKPVDMVQFTAAIQQFLLYWIGMNTGLD